ncbi:MAG: response regulator [Acidobacteria bacterium]|nr:response regulator [Acidobacteriota bacterium]
MNAPAEVRHETERHRPLVLIVEDQQDLRLLYVEHLTMSGFDVIEAANGAEAIDATWSRQPDVVLMDLSLPIVDGWEATRRLKADARTAHIPIVALTAHDGSGELQRATTAGCDWFVPKPCPPDALITEVRRVLPPHRAGVRGGDPGPSRPTAA